jgi:hypothetical protein
MPQRGGKLFNRLNEYRSAAIRYNKTAQTDLSRVNPGCILLFYRKSGTKGDSQGQGERLFQRFRQRYDP